MKIVEWLSCLMLSCCLYSCSLTKNKDLHQQKQESHLGTSIKERTIEKANIKKLVEITDSTTSNFSMFIKPIGNFSYSDQYGFIGNAEYIILRGQSSNRQQTIKSENTKAESVTEKKMELVQKAKVSLSEKTVTVKRTLPFWVYFLLGLPLIWLGYVLVKKIKKYT